MADPKTTLEPRFEAALRAALGEDFAKTDPVIRRSDRADFQADVAMAPSSAAPTAPTSRPTSRWRSPRRSASRPATSRR
jgi:arginyl-tRNA synthetase